MTETIQQLKEDIAVLQEKLQKLEEIEKLKKPYEPYEPDYYPDPKFKVGDFIVYKRGCRPLMIESYERGVYICRYLCDNREKGVGILFQDDYKLYES